MKLSLSETLLLLWQREKKKEQTRWKHVMAVETSP